MPTTQAPAPAQLARSLKSGATRTIGLTLRAASVAALLFAALWLRIDQLGNIPGVNGDEAWSGVQALRWLQGETIPWRTPSGNPINLFFLAPLVALHAVLPASFALLRSVSVACGVLALGANYALCRKTFDARTAVVSTLLLAILPIDIAYSRFAWDASQSLLATVLVLYLPLLPRRGDPLGVSVPTIAIIAFAAAIIVHPTNVFAAPLLLTPLVHAHRREIVSRLRNITIAAKTSSLVTLVIVSVAIAYAAALGLRYGAGRLHGPAEIGVFAANYLELLSGAAVYEYISGAAFGAADAPWGVYLPTIANVLFAALAIGALWGLKRRLDHAPTPMDECLIWGWFTMLTGFFVIAGPRAIAPHFERYGICLIAPGALVLARGIAWWLDPMRSHAKAVAVVLTAFAWVWLASFHAGYFTFVERTGGRSHDTFRTASIEPKLAAYQHIRAHGDPSRATRIVCRDWWNYWPLEYLALGGKDSRRDDNSPGTAIEVLTWPQWQGAANSAAASRAEDTWFVEFAGSPTDLELLRRTRERGIILRRKTIYDAGGRELLSILGPAENISQNY